MKEITLDELERELMEDIEWSGKSIYEDSYDEILKYKKEIIEHIIIGMSLVYLPCIWTVGAVSLLNRDFFYMSTFD